MSMHPYSHLVGHAFKHSKNMPPVGQGKNPLLGFVLGFLFGPIGVGIYLGSLGDFAITLGLVLAGTFLTAGVAAPLLWTLCGAWALVRIKNSNSRVPAGDSEDSTSTSQGELDAITSPHASAPLLRSASGEIRQY